MACLADINVSQGSVATCARCGAIFNIRLTTNLPKNLPVKKFKIGSDLTELWPRVCGPTFFGPLCSSTGTIFSLDGQTLRVGGWTRSGKLTLTLTSY